jgi:hypothetical protein
MRVYTTGEKTARQKSFIMCIAPAAHLAGQEVPSDWVNDKNEPIEINVEFIYGVAEVSDSIGKYLVKHQMASRTKLIIPDGVVVS